MLTLLPRAAHLAAAALIVATPRAVASSAPALAAPAPSFAEPGLSPDHREIAFASGGDIWTVPFAGAPEDTRLTIAFDVVPVP